MKLKSIALLSASGLLALTGVIPLAMADDMGNNLGNQSQYQPPSMQTPSDNAVPNQSNDMLGNMQQNDNMENNPNNNEMSPDTVTGDDDY